MQLLEFGQRFLNYKAAIMVVNNHTGKVEYLGMFVDCPYRLLRFADVVRIDLDEVSNVIKIYITSNGKMFFDTISHFSDSLLTE
jgi:hypothetical protein